MGHLEAASHSTTAVPPKGSTCQFQTAVSPINRQIENRDNNFNLIRMVAALSVLVAHCFPLTRGPGAWEPLVGAIGMTLGSVAVDVFFVSSGFLVGGSLMQRQRVVDFIWARILRIFPALLVMLLLTVTCIGLYFTTESVVSYMTSAATWRYFFGNVVLIGAGTGAGLPGVFVQNPFSGVVNGSLWTLPYEVAMYLALIIGWCWVRWLPGFLPVRFGRGVAIFAAALCAFEIASHLGFVRERSTVHLAYMFFVGAACHVIRQRIYLSWYWFLGLTLLLAASGTKRSAFQCLYILFIPYMTVSAD